MLLEVWLWRRLLWAPLFACSWFSCKHTPFDVVRGLLGAGLQSPCYMIDTHMHACNKYSLSTSASRPALSQLLEHLAGPGLDLFQVLSLQQRGSGGHTTHQTRGLCMCSLPCCLHRTQITGKPSYSRPL
jgi:hypothetical protein